MSKRRNADHADHIEPLLEEPGLSEVPLADPDVPPESPLEPEAPAAVAPPAPEGPPVSFEAWFRGTQRPPHHRLGMLAFAMEQTDVKRRRSREAWDALMKPY